MRFLTEGGKAERRMSVVPHHRRRRQLLENLYRPSSRADDRTRSQTSIAARAFLAFRNRTGHRAEIARVPEASLIVELDAPFRPIDNAANASFDAGG
jgi:hypothetical protein